MWETIPRVFGIVFSFAWEGGRNGGKIGTVQDGSGLLYGSDEGAELLRGETLAMQSEVSRACRKEQRSRFRLLWDGRGRTKTTVFYTE